MEYISALLVSVIIVVLGVELIISSFEKIFTPDPITDKFILNCVVLVLAIIVKIVQALVNFNIAKKINSDSLRATALDSRNDVIATSVVLIGLCVSHFSGYNIDSYLGLAMGIFIVVSGLKLVFESMGPILGEAPDVELVKKFTDIILSEPRVLGIHDLTMHNYGPNKYFASCHTEVDSKSDLLEIHDVIDNLELKVKTELGILTTLHLDPILVGDPLTDEMKEFVTEVLKDTLDFKYSFHDFRVVSGPTHINVIFDILLPFGLKESEEEITGKIKKAIKEKKSNVFAVINVDYDYNNVLETLIH